MLRTVPIRSRIAGMLELVIAAWALLRFTQARAAASATAEAANAATGGAQLFELLWSAFTIVTPLVVGLWLILRGPTWLIDKLMLISFVAAIWFFAVGMPDAIGSTAAMASSLAAVGMAFACWKLTRDDLALLAVAAAATAVAAIALVEAFASEDDLGVGGWVESDGEELRVVASPAPARARLLARDEMGGWFELPAVDASTGVATIDLPAGRWYLALQSPAPLEVATTLRVLRGAPAAAEQPVAAFADGAAAPLAA